MKVYTVGDIIAKGQGIGRKSAYGPVVIAQNAKEAEQKMTDGAVLVTKSTDRDMIASLEKASALITEEGGLTSHLCGSRIKPWHSGYRWSGKCDVYFGRWPRYYS